MNEAVTSAREFLADVSTLLRDADSDQLRTVLVDRWPTQKLSELMASADPATAATALKCMGRIGGLRDCDTIARLLNHEHSVVAECAEDALWRIWMRAGTRDGNSRLARAIELIGRDDLSSAAVALEELTRCEPGFAEAHHQLGIVYSLLDRLDEADREFRRAVELNPTHFSAVANLGHVAANREDIEGAAAQYRKALEIHPRIEGLAEILAEIESVIPPRW